MNGGNWYVRQYGKVQGPFPWAQLPVMKAKGDIGSFAELSQDQVNWVNALQVFPPPPPLPRTKPKPPPGPENKTTNVEVSGQGGHGKTMMGQVDNAPLEPFPDSTPLPRPAVAARPASHQPGDGLWYYGVEEQQYGPVSFDQLQQMVARGDLQAGDMVWEQGGPDGWLPVSAVPELGGKPNHLLWIIPLGCFVLLLLGIGVISLIVFLVNRR